MSVRLLDSRLRGVSVSARVPFRFGIVEMVELVHVFLFVTMDIDGTRQLGVAADNLSPKWYTKDPETSYRDDAAEMVGVIESACAIARQHGASDTVFDLWHAVHEQARRDRADVAPLLVGLGVSLVERAAIDAYCRARNVSFAQAVRTNALGIRLGTLHPGLDGRRPHEFLPRRPLTRLNIRHTVGLGDSLVGSEDAGASPVDDLPVTLEAWIREDGLSRFKVKVGGDRAADLDRLGRVREVLDRETRGDYRVTLDGNEQLADVPALQALWDGIVASPETAELARQIDYVEQPLPRELALSAETSTALSAWLRRPHLIIDESDDSLDAVARAIESGYHGGAFKSSKGVFKGIGNACRLEQLRREQPERSFVYSAEDSSLIGPVGLLADLAVIATLGIDGPERNGHHYLSGLAGLPPRVHEETVRHHGDLYALREDGTAALRIVGGAIDLGSVVAAPFGVAWPCDFEDDLDSAESLVAALP
jgi:hypothetical protein